MQKQYLYGTEFTVMTDYASLPSLYNTTRPVPHRVERHQGRLRLFQFKVQHVPGNQMPCDYASRHPDPLPNNMTKEDMEEMGIETEETDKEVWVSRIIDQSIPAITLKDMREATAQDPELANLLEEKRNAKKSSATSKGPYGKIREELNERYGILKRGKKLVVPQTLQAQATAIAHKGHQQSNGTLRLLRETQWFRNMRKSVKEFVDSCKCQAVSPASPTPPKKLKPLPKTPWHITCVDYKGPMGPKQYYLHTQMDA